MNKTLIALAISALACAAYAPNAHAYQAGDWVARIGLGNVNPKSDNGTLAGTLDLEVGSDVKPTLALSYFLTDHVAAQVLAAWPFDHDYDLNGANSGSLKHLPPTVTFQYHFNPTGPFNVYIGAGVTTPSSTTKRSRSRAPIWNSTTPSAWLLSLAPSTSSTTTGASVRSCGGWTSTATPNSMAPTSAPRTSTRSSSASISPTSSDLATPAASAAALSKAGAALAPAFFCFRDRCAVRGSAVLQLRAPGQRVALPRRAALQRQGAMYPAISGQLCSAADRLSESRSRPRGERVYSFGLL